MNDDKKVYPLNGYIDVGMLSLPVTFSSEKDEQKTRLAAQNIRTRLKELSAGFDDSLNEVSAMLLVQLMLENMDMKSRLEYSVDKATLRSIDNILDSVDDL